MSRLLPLLLIPSPWVDVYNKSYVRNVKVARLLNFTARSKCVVWAPSRVVAAQPQAAFKSKVQPKSVVAGPVKALCVSELWICCPKMKI